MILQCTFGPFRCQFIGYFNTRWELFPLVIKIFQLIQFVQLHSRVKDSRPSGLKEIRSSLYHFYYKSRVAMKHCNASLQQSDQCNFREITKTNASKHDQEIPSSKDTLYKRIHTSFSFFPHRCFFPFLNAILCYAGSSIMKHPKRRREEKEPGSVWRLAEVCRSPHFQPPFIINEHSLFTIHLRVSTESTEI